MKKLVLIPQERYEQLVSREAVNQSGGANEQEVKEEEKKQENAETKEPVSIEEHTPIETVKEEKLMNATPPVPPPVNQIFQNRQVVVEKG